MEVSGRGIRRDVVCRQVKLTQTCIPNPEGGLRLRERRHELTTDDCPPVVPGYAVPYTISSLVDRIACPHRISTPPELQRRTRRSARTQTVHPAPVAVVSHECLGPCTERLLGEDGPVSDLLPRRFVAPTTPRIPVLTIVWHACRRTVEHLGQTLLAPPLPLRRRPRLPLQRRLYHVLGFLPVAPPAQIISSCTRRDSAHEIRSAMIHLQPVRHNLVSS